MGCELVVEHGMSITCALENSSVQPNIAVLACGQSTGCMGAECMQLAVREFIVLFEPTDCCLVTSQDSNGTMCDKSLREKRLVFVALFSFHLIFGN